MLIALVETLEVEVRSKFQTSRRMSDASQGEAVEVPFDEALVRYLWRGERDFYVVGVELRASSKAALVEQQLLQGLDGEGSAGQSTGGGSSEDQLQQLGSAEGLDGEGEGEGEGREEGTQGAVDIGDPVAF